MERQLESPTKDKALHHSPDTMNDNEATTCRNEKTDDLPILFMEGLPQDFATNPQLAAIASLLKEEDEKPAKSPPSLPQGKLGGGKIRSSVSRRQRRQQRNAPYKSPAKASTKTSVNETQLFLNMWKL